MKRKELIEQFEKDLYEYAQLYIENRQKNCNDYLHNDKLADMFFFIYGKKNILKESSSLLHYFMSPIHLLNIYIGGFHIAIGYKLNKLTETGKIHIKSVEFKNVESEDSYFSDISFLYGDYSLLYYPSKKKLQKFIEDSDFVSFDKPYHPYIQDKFHSFLLKQDIKEIEKLSYEIEKAKFKLYIWKIIAINILEVLYETHYVWDWV